MRGVLNLVLSGPLLASLPHLGRFPLAEAPGEHRLDFDPNVGESPVPRPVVVVHVVDEDHSQPQQVEADDGGDVEGGGGPGLSVNRYGHYQVLK